MSNDSVKYIGFRDIKFVIVGIVVLGFLVPRIFFGIEFSSDPFALSSHLIESMVFAAIYWVTTRYIMIAFRKKYPSFHDSKKRIILTVLVSVIVTGITCIVLNYGVEKLMANVNGEHIKPTLVQGLIATYVSIIFFLAVYETIWYYFKLKEAITDQEMAKVAHVQTQLDGLRNQVNPHFLFNSLNTLNHIVETEDKSVAKKFIAQLSKVYRYILESREETTITLGEELEFVKAYIDIQKERFLDNLLFEINLAPNYMGKKIIPLSLQLLIENAIKHNVISSNKPLMITIDIDEKQETVRVTNNLQRKSKVLHSTRVGLNNITKRYKLLSEDKLAVVEETESHFRVVLPLLN